MCYFAEVSLPAAKVPAPAVQSLTNAAMEYNTNVEGKATDFSRKSRSSKTSMSPEAPLATKRLQTKGQTKQRTNGLSGRAPVHAHTY